MPQTIPIDGICDPAFSAVRKALEQNLADGDEIGECVAVVVEGRSVVDIWGGYKDRARTQPWQADTLACMFSVGKPISILPVLMLAERGRIDLDAPVVNYWPEFGQTGKEQITIRHIISHQAAIPGAFTAEKGDAYHWGKMIRAIEAQEPLWEPGTSGCYHTVTLGYLTGELVRRITGRTIGQFLQEEVCLPLGVDYHFGLSAADQRRCAEIYEAPDGPFMDAIRDPNTLLGKCWIPLPLKDHEEDFNSELYRASEMPSFNGHGTARSVARLFCALACGGDLDGVRLISQTMRDEAITEAWQQTDALGMPCRMSHAGFMLRNDTLAPYNRNPRAFGHLGLGGAIAYGDPDAKLGFSFCGNRMASTADHVSYAKRLLEATESCL
jgi:CubicO group peptidase (beta-lactamase class C family)